MKDSFKKYFIDLIGEEEAEAFFKAIEAKETRRGIRVNTLKVSRDFLEKWLSSRDYTVKKSPFSEDTLELEGKGQRWSLKLPYYSGFTYPQDPSSSFVIDLLDPQPGETVIDMTAAPGGKSTHIAQRMENQGVLFCNDMDTRRLKALHSNLERLGIWNAVVLRMNAHKLSLMYPEQFDRVLLDPSCSGEGLLNTHEGKSDYWSPKALKHYAQDQFSLLCSAFRLLKPGGRLVYSTCTLNAVEDDEVVKKLLKRFPEAQLVDERPEHTPPQIGDLMGIRFWPHKTQTKGFFCIAITKNGSLNLETEDPPSRRLKAAGKHVYAVRKDLEKSYGIKDFPWEWVERDGFFFAVSPQLMHMNLPGKYSLSFPVYKEDRLTHAAALWAGQHTEQKIDVEDCAAFFEEQKIELQGTRNYELIAHGDFPLGIAKQEGEFLHPLTIKVY